MSESFNIADITEDDDDGQDRIVCFSLGEDRKLLNVGEECDCYFDADLTKPQVRKLIDRLEALYAQMEE